MTPMVGQSIWLVGRRQPNGVISRIDYDEREVHCFMYDMKLEVLDLDELEGNWIDRFERGGWWIER